VGNQVARPHGPHEVVDGVQDQLRLLVGMSWPLRVPTTSLPPGPAGPARVAASAIAARPPRPASPAARGRVVALAHDQRHRPQRGPAVLPGSGVRAGPDVDSLRIQQPVGRGSLPPGAGLPHLRGQQRLRPGWPGSGWAASPGGSVGVGAVQASGAAPANCPGSPVGERALPLTPSEAARPRKGRL
jgi:hypothetical protein